ncbi:MAG: methyltransferase domain-containing protein, partial [Acidobacteriota bacterium]|nr:methyltransferase domain-containing protein [Acidobacteriota bacterium]
MRKLLTGWIVAKLAALCVFCVMAVTANSSFAGLSGGAAATPTPTPTPAVDDSIDRETSDPYTGDLARFDRENRAENLQIDRVMDILGIKEGSSVADIGAGGGWFSAIASKRAGKTGKVYAVDISRDSIDFIDKRIAKEKLENIETILGIPDDPKLPEKTVDAVLILNTYHEIAEPVRFLRNLAKSLKTKALVGIIDREGKGDDHGIDPAVVKKEAERVGLKFVAAY